MIVDSRGDNPDTVGLRQACFARGQTVDGIPRKEYKLSARCVYRTPLAAGDASAQLQLIQNAIAHNAAAIAVAPANSDAMWQLLRGHAQLPPLAIVAEKPSSPLAIIAETHISPQAARWRGDRPDVAADLANKLKQLNLAKGNFCLQLGDPASAASNEREGAFWSAIPAMGGVPVWSQIADCPIYSNGDPAVAARALVAIVTQHPELDALILIDDAALADSRTHALIRRHPKLAILAPDPPSPMGDEETLFENLLPNEEPACSPCQSATQDDCVRIKDTSATVRRTKQQTQKEARK